MTVWKRILFIAGAFGGLCLLLLAGVETFGWYAGWHTGTLDEAAAKVRAHRDDVLQISNIVTRDPALGWVTPSFKPADLTRENGPLTKQAISDYDTIAGLLARGEFRDLAILRDKKPPHALLFMRFVIFDPGWFGYYKPVLAEWGAPSELEYSSGTSCIAVDDGWFVCQTDP